MLSETTKAMLKAAIATDAGMTPAEKKTLGRMMEGSPEKVQLITSREAAEILGVCRKTLYSYADKGRLTRICHSKRAVRFNRTEVETLAYRGMEDARAN